MRQGNTPVKRGILKLLRRTEKRPGSTGSGDGKMGEFTVRKLTEPLAAVTRIYFGEYTQGEDDVKTPILWRVLARRTTDLRDQRVRFGREEYNHK